ncbi:MAG: TetR/AcrR family transcriptional regulator [Tannerella sp.]|jgi:AcrR family transcriptional regulator|nr:TetR/AcrR family transcriptional regulator [Tannerella sp.]
MKPDTKDFILKESFKLFAWKRYEQVTVSDLERVTKLTRGSIFYYMKNKEHLFQKVLDKYIFNQEMILNCDKTTLSSFIHSFIEQVKLNKEQMNSLGVKNADFAYINIANQAVYFYPEYIKIAIEKEETEMALWKEVIKSAVLKGEVVKNTDVDIYANIFHKLYSGFSYGSIILTEGIDADKLAESFNAVYRTIKK